MFKASSLSLLSFHFFLSLTLELLQSPHSPVVSPSCLLSLIQALNFHSHSLTQEVKLNYSHYLAVSLHSHSLYTCLSFSPFCLLFGRAPGLHAVPVYHSHLFYIGRWWSGWWGQGFLLAQPPPMWPTHHKPLTLWIHKVNLFLAYTNASRASCLWAAVAMQLKHFVLNLSIFQWSSFDDISSLMDWSEEL